MRYDGESPQIPTGEGYVRDGRLCADFRSGALLIRIRLPDDVAGVVLDLDRLASGLDLIAGNPVRDGYLYLRSIGGLTHQFRGGIGAIIITPPVTQPGGQAGAATASPGCTLSLPKAR